MRSNKLKHWPFYLFRNPFGLKSSSDFNFNWNWHHHREARHFHSILRHRCSFPPFPYTIHTTHRSNTGFCPVKLSSQVLWGCYLFFLFKWINQLRPSETGLQPSYSASLAPNWDFKWVLWPIISFISL